MVAYTINRESRRGEAPLIKTFPSPCKGEGIKGIGLINNLVKQALKRSRDAWFTQITRLFDRTTIGEAVWTELEELLISADVGVNTTEKLIEKVKRRVAEERISHGSQVCSALKAEMVDTLNIKI